MKKALSLILVLILCLSLCACGGTSNGTEPTITEPTITEPTEKELKDFTEEVIAGGCHAYFGMYGNQKGDGVATISSKEQIEITANEIINFIKE